MSELDAAGPDSQPVEPRVSGGRTARRIARLRFIGGDDDHVVMYFKERIYATFTGLAIVLVVTAPGNPSIGRAVIALIFGVLGITAAGFVSDVVSHLVVHQDFPTGTEFALLLRISGGALGTLVTRSKATWWRQLIALAMLMVLGLVVVVLQTLAHSA